MPELKITDNAERDILLSALISHVHKCRDILKLHNESKTALKENAITSIAQKADREMHAALTMIAKYFSVHLANSRFYCLNCATSDGEEHDRMADAEFAWVNDCSKCGNGAYYFVEPKIETQL